MATNGKAVPADHTKAATAVSNIVTMLRNRVEVARKSVRENADDASMKLVMSAGSDITGLERIAKRLAAGFYA